MFRSRRRIRAFLPSFPPSICFVSYAAPHLRCWPFIVLSLTLKTNHSILAITRGKESNQSVGFFVLFCVLVRSTVYSEPSSASSARAANMVAAAAVDAAATVGAGALE